MYFQQEQHAGKGSHLLQHGITSSSMSPCLESAHSISDSSSSLRFIIASMTA